MGRVDELRLIARLAQMYHGEGRRQADIAATMHMSQATVSRMLKRAEAEGIVRTTVIPPAGTYSEFEAALRERYGLTEAIVTDCAEDQDNAIMARIGEAAAHFLESTLEQDEIIGVSSWSQTILRMVDNVHPMRSAKAKYVVQILGGMGDASVQIYATQATARLAKLTGGEPRLLLVQGITASPEARLVMQADPVVRGTMDMFAHISLAIIGIGAVEPSEMLARSGNVFSHDEMTMLNQAGAVGEISYRFFDKDGRQVTTPLNDRVIGISVDELRRADRVMAVAGGVAKTVAIQGALKLGIIDILVTDKFTAARLLA